VKSDNAVPGEGILHALRETIDGLGDLVGQHLRLARLELKSDLVAALGRARTIAVLALLVGLGYGMAMAGLAVWLGGAAGVGFALMAVGAGHLVVGGAGLFLLGRPRHAAPMLSATSDGVRRSLETLTSTNTPELAAPGLPAPARHVAGSAAAPVGSVT
jgi:hypothetical protein